MAEDSSVITQRLREFLSAKGAPASETVQQEMSAPVGMTRPHTVDPVQEKISSFLSNTVRLTGISDKFKDVPEVTEGMIRITTDFPDNKFLDAPGIELERLTEAQIAALGRSVIPMLSSGFSPQGAGALFVLAYHLQDPAEEGYAMDPCAEVCNLNDVQYSSLSQTTSATRQEHEPLPAKDDTLEAKAYAYIAASTLRLFTKSEDNYVKAFNHIIMGYNRFYGTAIPIAPPQPTIEAIRTLSHFFNHGQLFKATLYKILYMSATKKAEGLKKFLYEIHLANTGMHIVSIFVRLCGILNCSSGLLLTAIYSKEYERQITTMTTMLNLITMEDDAYKRKMWRYGRLFDEGFMSPLQTRSCPTLTYILACALKEESSKTNQDILNISQLADISQDKRKRCAAAAEMVVRSIREYICIDDASHYRKPSKPQHASCINDQ